MSEWWQYKIGSCCPHPKVWHSTDNFRDIPCPCRFEGCECEGFREKGKVMDVHLMENELRKKFPNMITRQCVSWNLWHVFRDENDHDGLSISSCKEHNFDTEAKAIEDAYSRHCVPSDPAQGDVSEKCKTCGRPCHSDCDCETCSYVFRAIPAQGNASGERVSEEMCRATYEAWNYKSPMHLLWHELEEGDKLRWINMLNHAFAIRSATTSKDKETLSKINGIFIAYNYSGSDSYQKLLHMEAEMLRAKREVESMNRCSTLTEEDAKTLLAAINWAMGCDGDFVSSQSGKSSFWWRKELVLRAGIVYDSELQKYVIAGKYGQR